MGDFEGSNYDDKFIASLVDFVASDEFQTMFEGFFINHALVFSSDEEHKLEYYDLYKKFHKMFDDQLEKFCSDLGMTQSEFMKKCRSAASDDPKVQHYINILMSSVEYETFVKLMKIMRPVAIKRMSVEADAKEGAKLESSPSKSMKEEGGSSKAESKGPDDILTDDKFTDFDEKGSK